MVLTIGKDYDYVRNEMDIPRLNALNASQEKTPPTNLGVQRLCRILEAFMGIEDSTPSAQDHNEDDLEEMLNAFPQG